MGPDGFVHRLPLLACCMLGCFRPTEDTSHRHKTFIVAAALSADDRFVVSVDGYGEMGKWDLQSEKPVRWARTGFNHANPVRIAPGARLAAIKGLKQAGPTGYEIFETESGRQVCALPRDLAMAWLGSERFITWKVGRGQENPTFAVWEIRERSAHLLREIPRESGYVRGVHSVDANRIIVRGGHRQRRTDELVLSEIESGKILRRLSVDVPTDENERAMSSSDCGERVIIWGRSLAEVYDTESLRLIHRIEVPKGNPDFQIGAIGPSARFAALGMSRMELWDLSSNQLLLLDPMEEEARLQKQFAARPLEEGMAEGLRQLAITMWSLAFSSDGKTLVGVTFGGHVYVWDVEKRERLQDFYITEPPPKK